MTTYRSERRMNVAVDERSQLLLICDYLEKAGLIATLSTLEAEAGVQSSLPGLAAVRRLALDGKWRELEEALLRPAEQSTEDGDRRNAFKRAKFSLAKQQYLETVAGLDAVSAHREPSTEELGDLRRCLERLKQLSPSSEEYSSLEALSHSETDFFDGWDLLKTRKETCNDLLSWSRKACFHGREEKGGEHESSAQVTHPLTVLLAKGKFYEKCEEIFSERCASLPATDEQSRGAVLDIGSWLYNQPRSVFEAAAPRVIYVVAAPPSSSSPHPSPQNSGNNTTPRAPSQHDSTSSQLQPTISRPPSTSQAGASSVTTILEPPPHSVSPERAKPIKKVKKEKEQMTGGHAVSKSTEKDGETERRESQRSSSPLQRSMEERITEHRDNVETATNMLRASLKDNEVGVSVRDPQHTAPPQNPGKEHTHPQEETPVKLSPQPPSEQPTSGLPPSEDSSTQPPLWLLQTTPLVQAQKKRERDSSTPKPSTQRLISSPATSPVPHLPEFGLQPTLTEEEQQGPLSERKQIDFDQDTTCSGKTEGPFSTSWPSAALVKKITDTQAVRSVAFSGSGEFVAVGANSKYLRIFSTSALLDNERDSDEEISALQEYSRYHRGSIYCLVWNEDTLLASGSNDRTIKLLGCRPNSHDSASISCSTLGRLSSHDGTVRELVFLSSTSGHLASCGAGTRTLVISDCHTLKTLCSPSGHKGQVLAVASGGSGGSTLVSGGEDETVRVWDWSASGSCIHSLHLPEPVTSLSCLDHHLAAALLDGSCLVYDVRNWREVSSLHPHSGECRSVRHSHCGRWLLTGSYDGSVCLGEATGVGWEEVARHGDKVIQARWHPHRAVFASTSTDKTVCFWTIQS